MLSLIDDRVGGVISADKQQDVSKFQTSNKENITHKNWWHNAPLKLVTQLHHHHHLAVWTIRWTSWQWQVTADRRASSSKLSKGRSAAGADEVGVGRRNSWGQLHNSILSTLKFQLLISGITPLSHPRLVFHPLPQLHSFSSSTALARATTTIVPGNVQATSHLHEFISFMTASSSAVFIQ